MLAPQVYKVYPLYFSFWFSTSKILDDWWQYGTRITTGMRRMPNGYLDTSKTLLQLFYNFFSQPLYHCPSRRCGISIVIPIRRERERGGCVQKVVKRLCLKFYSIICIP